MPRVEVEREDFNRETKHHRIVLLTTYPPRQASEALGLGVGWRGEFTEAWRRAGRTARPPPALGAGAIGMPGVAPFRGWLGGRAKWRR